MGKIVKVVKNMKECLYGHTGNLTLPLKKLKKCYNNWKEVGKLNNINLLNPDNITKYIPEDEYKKYVKMLII